MNMEEKKLPINPGKDGKVDGRDFPWDFYSGLAIDEFALTGNSHGKIFHIWDLAAANPKNFEKIFKLSEEPDLQSFRDRTFNGMNFHINLWGLGKLVFALYVGRLRDVFTNRLFSQHLAFQKRLLKNDKIVKRKNKEGEVSGINYWCRRDESFLPFKIYMSPGIKDSTMNSLKIDYNVLQNKRIIQRPLIDEMRKIPGSELYLGKMYFRLGPWPIFFLWFGMEEI